jgi:hypothetical protein
LNKKGKHQRPFSRAPRAIHLFALASLLGTAAFAQSTTSDTSPASGTAATSKMVQSNKRPLPAIAEVETAAEAIFNDAQGPGPGPIGPGPGCNLFPAPASIGTTVPLSYFGPPPSSQNPSLVGPEQLLKSGQLDVAHGTITLPLYLGHMAGTKKNVWYILTDVDDPGVAAELGLRRRYWTRILIRLMPRSAKR